MIMKIDAIVREEKFEDVKNALMEIEVNGLTVSQVMGCGLQRGYKEIVRGMEVEPQMQPKVKFEIVVSSEEWAEKTIEAIKKITGKDFKFYEINYLNQHELERVFKENNIEAVLNFAGYKAVGESVEKPIEYYINNVSGALILLNTMRKYGVKKFVFSSSATVYGEPEKIPITEDCKTGGTTNKTTKTNNTKTTTKKSAAKRSHIENIKPSGKNSMTETNNSSDIN